ncbi:MAG TPA: plastocyanin/azurin family copper-binding protein [Gemmatimonadaceae bacterium]|nr:plastocyanin/azurin family copper-binding protein [Gemmatimonadaceae bacterium]
MRFPALTLIAGAAVLGACGGGAKKAADTTSAGPKASPGAPAAATSIPANGDTVDVKMIGDAQGYRFEPADVSIKPGGAVKFVMVSGGPHNISFDPATIPPDVKDQLNANMDQKVSELSSPLLMNPNETYTISFGGIKPGKYEFHCTPHLAMGMKGSVTVQ